MIRFNRLIILIYHRVLDYADPMRPFEVDRAAFESQLETLQRWCDVLPLKDAMRCLNRGRFPRNSVSITFDDGYKDNWDNAYPLLKKHGLPATFFITTGQINGGPMFNELVIESVRNAKPGKISIPKMNLDITLDDSLESRLAAVSAILARIKDLAPATRQEIAMQLATSVGSVDSGRLMMNETEIRDMHAGGMEIGAHTVNHPILSTLGEDAAAREIESSKSALESITGNKIVGFAYPNGKPGRDFGSRDVRIVERLGFEYAVSTEWGGTKQSCNVYSLPRIAPARTRSATLLLRLLKAKL